MNKNQKDRRGRVNYIWAACGGYLIYTGYRVFSMFWKGTAGTPVVTVPAAVVFIIVGVLLLRREWAAYKYGKAHMDDPDTWADADETPNSLEEPLPPVFGDEEDALPDHTEEESSDGESRGERE